MSSPPTKEEMQYASDVIHGKRKLDRYIILGSTIAGGIFGIAVGFSSAQANSEPLDIGFTFLCAVICAFTLGIVAALVMSALQTIIAICRAWLPARIIAIAACAVLAVKIVQKITFWIVLPSQAITDIVLGSLFLILAILIFNLGLRLIFIVYCMITGKDEEEIMIRSITAKTNKHNRQ